MTGIEIQTNNNCTGSVPRATQHLTYCTTVANAEGLMKKWLQLSIHAI